MVNTEIIKSIIADRGLKQGFIARKMGISDKRMSVLLSGATWKLNEVISFCNVMSLTKKQRDDIFFNMK